MIFYFLWGDPVFSQSFDQLKASVDDDNIALRRTLVLTFFDYLGTTSRVADESQAEIQKLKELHYQSAWREAQLLKHVPPDVIERIWVDLNVNRMDPDFSFENWVKNNDREVELRLACSQE